MGHPNPPQGMARRIYIYNIHIIIITIIIIVVIIIIGVYYYYFVYTCIYIHMTHYQVIYQEHRIKYQIQSNISIRMVWLIYLDIHHKYSISYPKILVQPHTGTDQTCAPQDIGFGCDTQFQSFLNLDPCHLSDTKPSNNLLKLTISSQELKMIQMKRNIWPPCS